MNVVQELSIIETVGGDPLLVAQACERLIAFAHARQLSAIHDLSQEEPAGYDECGQLCDPVPAELATALSWTAWTASRRVDLAHDLHDHLPELLDALHDGRVDLAKVIEIANGTCGLPPEPRAALAIRAVDYAQTHTRGQLRAWLARQVAAIDPEALRRRRAKASTKRRVWLQPEPDGMATLGAYITAEEATACLEALRVGAAGYEGGVDAARADLFVERLTGLSAAEPVPVQVIVMPGGQELAGYGPIGPEHAHYLCQAAPRIRLDRPSPTLSYTPTAALFRWVRARDRHCRFPGCRRPARACDLDHTIAYPTGSTSADNLHCLCRYHHRLKTHTDWTVRADADGSLLWTSPRGHRYRSEPDDP